MSLKRLGETQPIELHWRAFELRPEGSPPIPEEYRARIQANRPVFAARVKRDYGIELHEGPFGIKTRALHQLKKFADARGLGNAFHDAALDAYWMQGQDLSDPLSQQALFAQIGLEANVADILADENYLREVMTDEYIAQENGMSGVPALVFAEKYLVVGAQPLPILQQVVEQVRAEQDENT